MNPAPPGRPAPRRTRRWSAMTCANSPARHGTWAVALAVAALVLTGACDDGGGGDEGASRTGRPSVTGSQGPTTAGGSPSLSTSPTPTATAPSDPEQAEQDIRKAWTVLFDPKSSLDQRSDVVEDGDENALMIDNLFRDPSGSKLRAEVTSVAYTSDLDAEVAYDLTSEGRRLDTGGPGAAVLQEGG
ncbi:conserved hypothetical protein [Streptomyces sviceus ATCC 29083]|uniref:Low molecular weight antigen MTB12-like C-terminal domain-containing protein n=1 Tax=Streptomyces sviceus (strain ATCC 29083 / DSM 924 / JCM 4929 / NBRC 13980 / NCIMB 11184 / NRRL 5439 / UC 5370) TaxID=463191 RepID=B5HRK1_STRX2|nr:conserved hypothetical protein [Streptomyces sviceus ATCC 29083]